MQVEVDDEISQLVDVVAKSIRKGLIKLRISGQVETDTNIDFYSVEQNKIDKLLETSSIGDKYEKPDLRPKSELRRIEKEKMKQNAGPKWHGFQSTPLTEEVKRELRILQLRPYMYKDRHYKAQSKTLPKHFQLGEVVEGPTDFYSGRLTNKERSNTLVEELLKDSNFKSYTKQKFMEIQSKKTARKKTNRNFHKKKVIRK